MTLQARTILMVTGLLVVAVLSTATTLAWSARRSLLDQKEYDGIVIAHLLARSALFAQQVPRDVETAIGDQMVVQATLAAHMVAIAGAAGLSPDRINAHLRQITTQTALDEIWITDPNGHAYLRNRSNIDFTFSPDARRQPQAHVFWPLLTGQRRVVIQAARRREVDAEIYKYAGVAGIDQPRIVQVGYHATLLDRLRRQMGLERLVAELVTGGNLLAIRVVDGQLRTLAFGAARGQAVRRDLNEIDADDVRAAAREGHAISRLEGDALKVVAPAADPHGRLIATTLIYLPTVQVRAEMRRKLQLAVAVAGVVLGIGVLMAVVLARRVTEPVARQAAQFVGAPGHLREHLQPELSRLHGRRRRRQARVFERSPRCAASHFPCP
jgi:hypothetical protein